MRARLFVGSFRCTRGLGKTSDSSKFVGQVSELDFMYDALKQESGTKEFKQFFRERAFREFRGFLIT